MDGHELDDRFYACADCTCCAASGCHSGYDSLCPTDSLGDSGCPCTCP